MEGHLVWRPNFHMGVAVLAIAHQYEEDGEWVHLPVLTVNIDHFVVVYEGMVKDLTICRDLILEGKRLMEEGMSLEDMCAEVNRLVMSGDGLASGESKVAIPEDFIKAFERNDEQSTS